jgi:predicted GNAT family acetyltransferase
VDLTFVDEPNDNRYVVMDGNTEAGFVEYIRTHGDLIVFTHTEVTPEYEGRGIGSALAKHVLDMARDEGFKVLPICPFIAEWITRHPEYKAISYRAKPSSVKD